MYAGVERFEILRAEVCIDNARMSYVGCQFVKVGDVAFRHRRAVEHFVTETREVGVVGKVVRLEPERAEQRSNERSDNAADVDKYVEDLEAGVAFRLGACQCFRTLCGCLRLEVVVHLTYDSL